MPQYALIRMNHTLLSGLLLAAFSSVAQNALDAQGRRTGPWMAKYPYGQVRYEGQFDAGVPVGRFTYYHDNGFRSAQMDFRGTTGVCMSEQYDEKGKLMARGRFGSDRERDSIWTTYAFDGTKLEEASYTAGKLHGSYTMFYPNGKVMERGTYEHGAKVGTWTRFRETAAKERVVNYAAGLLQGTWTEYDEDGRVAVVGTYHNDLRHGKWTYFERGTAVRTEVYRRGILEKPSK